MSRTDIECPATVQENLDAGAAPDRLIGGVRIGMILLGALVALPAFVMGAKLNAALGTRDAIISSFGGGFVLAVISSAAAIAGTNSRKTSYQLVLSAFGSVGGKIVNGVLSVVMVGWFGVVAALFGHAVIQSSPALAFVGPKAWTAIGCVVMTFTTIVGFKALDILSIITVPLKIFLLAATVVAALRRFSAADIWSTHSSPTFSVAEGVSFVTGGVIVGALLTPDLARFAISKAQAAIACFLAFAVGTPVVLILSGIPARLTGQSDLVLIMVQVGLGLPAILIVMLAAWSSNAYNLYAISLVYRTLLARPPRWKLAVFGGIFGALLGIAGLSDALAPYLVILGVGIPPIGGVYLADYYLTWVRREEAPDRSWRPLAFAAWLTGVSFAAAETPLKFTLTTVTAIDSILLSIAAYVTLFYLSNVLTSKRFVART